MSDQSDHNAPHDTASALGIQPATLRRWCAYHAAHLSSGANPPAGQARRFDGRDLEVLRTVRALRAQGLTVAAINDQLAKLTFAVIDTEDTEGDSEEETDDQPGTAITPTPAQQEGQDLTPAVLMVVDALEKRFEAKLATFEQAKVNDRRLVRDGVFMFMAGSVVTLLLVLIIIVVVDLWAR